MVMMAVQVLSPQRKLRKLSCAAMAQMYKGRKCKTVKDPFRYVLWTHTGYY